MLPVDTSPAVGEITLRRVTVLRRFIPIATTIMILGSACLSGELNRDRLLWLVIPAGWILIDLVWTLRRTGKDEEAAGQSGKLDTSNLGASREVGATANATDWKAKVRAEGRRRSSTP